MKLPLIEKEHYVPKFCRTTGCGQPYDHDGDHTIRSGSCCPASKCRQRLGHEGEHFPTPVKKVAKVHRRKKFRARQGVCYSYPDGCVREYDAKGHLVSFTGGTHEPEAHMLNGELIVEYVNGKPVAS